MRRKGSIPILLLVLVVFGGFFAMVWLNADSAEPLEVIVPTEAQPTEISESWQDILRSGLNVQGTPVPTVAIPDRNYIAPTLAQDDAITTTPVSAEALVNQQQAVFVSGVTPTPPPPTSDGNDVVVIDANGASDDTQAIPTRIVATDRPIPTNPPPLDVPLARHPNDHFFFRRPIDSNKRNFGLIYYEYGTDGANDDLKIHHGIDMANDIGTTIRAAGSGTVIYASDETEVFQNSPSYGGVVVIEHDFSFQGKPLFTLYGHIEEPLVVAGQTVQAGDPIALLGNTGRSTGPHVQFEVRMGSNEYGSTYNPVLWMAPYVGHGVIAGQVIDERGNYLQDVDITLSRGGFVRDTTTSYVFRDVGSRVNVDPNWQENFVIPDVPEGLYTVEAIINGQRVSKIIDVQWGMVNFVTLEPLPIASNDEVDDEGEVIEDES